MMNRTKPASNSTLKCFKNYKINVLIATTILVSRQQTYRYKGASEDLHVGQFINKCL